MLTPAQFDAIDRHLRKENWLINEELIAELTDHYAAGIDERMTLGSSFADALHAVHTDFGGRKGLLIMEEEAQKQQSVRHLRLEWQLIRSFTQGSRWYVGAGLFILAFLLNRYPSQYDTLQHAYIASSFFVLSAVVGNLLAPIFLYIRAHHGLSLMTNTGTAPAFSVIYLLFFTLLLLNEHVLPAYDRTLSPDFVMLLTTTLETLCLIYLLSGVLLIRQLIREERKRRLIKTI